MKAADQLARRPSPILVLGMHRSGTSAVSRLLHGTGINMGRRQDSNAESRFFQRMNRWVLAQCGATWATVEPLPVLLNEHGEFLASVVERRVRSRFSLEHFGRSPDTQPWGFKDPRLALLHPLYDRVFPDCRVIIISRHGVDVAESLSLRATASMTSIGSDYRAPVLGLRQLGANRLQNALLASNRDRNFDLWVRYQQSLRAIERSIESSRVHRVRFEDLVENPSTCLTDLSDFLGQRVTGVDMVASRAFAHRTSSELSAFAAARASELRTFGY